MAANEAGLDTSTFVPTKDQHKSYEADGYLHVEGFFNAEELAQLRQYVKDLEDAPDEVGSYMKYWEAHAESGDRILSRVEDFCRRHAGFESMFMQQDAKMLQFSSNLLGGDELCLFKDKINFKLPGGDGFKAHQDQAAGWGKYIDWFMSIGVFVDAATEENGALEVAAGYHKDGLLGAEWTPIEDVPLPYKLVPCEPGDVIFFDSYVPHRSAPNNSDKPRRALFITDNKESEGYKLPDYYADKRRDFPPDIERPEGKVYTYRV